MADLALWIEHRVGKCDRNLFMHHENLATIALACQ
jgi:hypothetical protein